VKLGIVISSSDAETAWNAFRFGAFFLGKGNLVRVFLLGKGVESETLDTERFKVSQQMKSFVAQGGEILACGTCLKIRQEEGSELCPISTMDDLYELVHDSDRVLTF
jgi:uncharacterized protein involved in oxidation of intracellular sulfur